MISQPETGALTVARTLKRAGVRAIFSLSGNQIMPLYDACFEEGLRIVHVRHEGAAVYMADAYAQITGELGVALLTAGPGFANGLGALMTARAAESPVLLLSGDSPRGQDGLGAFQELDQCAAAGPLVKQSHRAAGPEGLGQAVAGAIAAARGGRPGPVHLALPFDSLTARTPRGEAAQVPAGAFAPAAQSLAPDAARQVADLIAGAERPLIVTGPQLSRSRAGDLPERLEAATGAPVICMESPRGLRDPALGALGAVAARSDLVVLLGKAADFTTAFLAVEPWDASARFVVIDPEAAMLSRARARLNGRLSAAAQADAPAAAEALIAAARPRDGAAWRDETGALLA
ncbi:thiamine pyrophosphate-binding protein, partial [Rhodobacteraceae bacterium WD3A24]